jgi:hypothetical protein
MADRGTNSAPLAATVPTEPGVVQLRAAALALLIIALFTAVLVAVQWEVSFDDPLLLLSLAGPYLLFNCGYAYCVVNGGLQTKGAWIGSGAALLYALATLLSAFDIVWTFLSLCAVAASLIAAYLLLNDAREAAAGPFSSRSGH